MTRLEASQLVAVLFASYPMAHVDRAHVDAYVSGLDDLDAESAARAVLHLRRTSRFLPSLAEIRDAATAERVRAERKRLPAAPPSEPAPAAWVVELLGRVTAGLTPPRAQTGAQRVPPRTWSAAELDAALGREAS